MTFVRFLIVVAFFVPCIHGAHAQSIGQVQAMTFGNGVIATNNSVQEITLLSDGSFTVDPGIILISNPQIGRYLLTGAAASRPINVSVTINQQLIGPGQDFSISDFDINAPATTNTSGEAQIDIGAKMSTLGTGSYMPSSAFNGLFTISITIN